MDLTQRAMDVVAEAEEALAGLAAEAASHRDYARAAAILNLAQRVADAVRSTLGDPSGDHGEEDSAVSSMAGEPAGIRSGVSIAYSPARPKLQSRPRKTGTTPYPHFKREDDTLVKVGWSKSDRTTYEHRSPRSVLDTLVRKIMEIGDGGIRFTTEHLLPLHDEGAAEYPSYQAYLCLAWLVTARLLDRHGRQGYTVRDAKELASAVENAWKAVPRR